MTNRYCGETFDIGGNMSANVVSYKHLNPPITIVVEGPIYIHLNLSAEGARNLASQLVKAADHASVVTP